MINILRLDFKIYKSERNMNIIYKQRDLFLNKVANKIIILNCNNLLISHLKIIFERPKFIFKITINLFILPFKIISIIPKIINPNNSYFLSLQDSIIDGLERKTGQISKKSDLKFFIKKHFLQFIVRSIYLIILLDLIELIKEIENINTLYIDQNAGFPFGAISSYCYNNKISICRNSLQERLFDNSLNISLLISKRICDDRIAFPHDLENLSKISTSELDKYINLIKGDFEKKKDPLSNPDFIKFDKSIKIKNLSYYKNLNKNDKKNGIVLMHIFTDHPRKRCEDIWINNYLEWLYLTIENCKKNNNVNWFFKAHPFHTNISTEISKKQELEIEEKIVSSGFTYIESYNKFLHNEVSKLGSVVVTCHGTCKIEFPALYSIPVISCISYKDLSYDSLSQAFTAKNSREYERLILNAHKLRLSEKEIRLSKELLVFNKLLSGKNINEDLTIQRYLDYDRGEIIRNY